MELFISTPRRPGREYTSTVNRFRTSFAPGSLRSGKYDWSSFRIKERCACTSLTRLNKIAIQGKGPDGRWTRRPLAYRESNSFYLCVTALLRYVSTLFLNVFTVLAITRYVDNFFHSFILLCENEYFLNWLIFPGHLLFLRLSALRCPNILNICRR